jgi:hypothetical protein
MSALRRGVPTPLWRLLTILAAVGQLLVVGATWLDSTAGGRDERAHVEGAGTRLHYVHDDGACEFCALQHLASVPTEERRRPPTAAPAEGAPAGAEDRPVSGPHARTTRSRAPPRSV